jgi:predicted Rossmann-fold nucleotide-binding protein
VKYHHRRFSSRLDEFMRISHAVVVTPGGIGTMLELFYTWQLMQVGHIAPRPFLLLGGMWEGLLDWMEKYPLDRKLMDRKDFDQIILVRSVDEVVTHLMPSIQEFYKKKAEAETRA